MNHAFKILFSIKIIMLFLFISIGYTAFADLPVFITPDGSTFVNINGEKTLITPEGNAIIQNEYTTTVIIDGVKSVHDTKTFNESFQGSESIKDSIKEFFRSEPTFKPSPMTKEEQDTRDFFNNADAIGQKIDTGFDTVFDAIHSVGSYLARVPGAIGEATGESIGSVWASTLTVLSTAFPQLTTPTPSAVSTTTYDTSGSGTLFSFDGIGGSGLSFSSMSGSGFSAPTGFSFEGDYSGTGLGVVGNGISFSEGADGWYGGDTLAFFGESVISDGGFSGYGVSMGYGAAPEFGEIVMMIVIMAMIPTLIVARTKFGIGVVMK